LELGRTREEAPSGIRQKRDSEEADELLETGFTQIYRTRPPGFECSTPHSCKIEVEKKPNVKGLSCRDSGYEK
jgi:hypothetical protein